MTKYFLTLVFGLEGASPGSTFYAFIIRSYMQLVFHLSLGIHVQVSSWRDFQKSGKKVLLARKMPAFDVLYSFGSESNVTLCYLSSGQKRRDSSSKIEDRGS